MDKSKMQLPLLSAYSDQRLGSSCPSHAAALMEPGRYSDSYSYLLESFVINHVEIHNL